MDLNVPRKIAVRCRHDSASSLKSVGSRKKASEQRFVNSPTINPGNKKRTGAKKNLNLDRLDALERDTTFPMLLVISFEEKLLSRYIILHINIIYGRSDLNIFMILLDPPRNLSIRCKILIIPDKKI
ncbi:hypothetical protein V1478_015668 [Vespula squamosa]|uniref:Uncharacterized protein n=1 Tax=Vespula squamosa TaxID=30214 RepID=A0ABD2A1H7_VESSQ